MKGFVNEDEYVPSMALPNRNKKGYRAERIKDASERFAKGKIKWADVRYIFKKGVEVSFEHFNVIHAGKVYYVEKVVTPHGPIFSIDIIVFGPNVDPMNRTNVFSKGCITIGVQQYTGVKSCSELPIQILTPEVKNTLSGRGDQILKFLNSHLEFKKERQYSYVNGLMLIPHNGGFVSRSGIKENIIFDINSDLYQRWFSGVIGSNTQYRFFSRPFPKIEYSTKGENAISPIKVFSQLLSSRDNREDEMTSIVYSQHNKDFVINIPREEVFSLSPYYFAFSLEEDSLVLVDILSIVERRYDINIINDLVLGEDEKNVLISVAESSREMFTDVVEDKSGGVVCLLHGEPGVGKTLTAEVLSEYLQIPLYKIHVRNMGSDNMMLEHNLNKIMDFAKHWNLVLLLDEADVFLENRDSNDLERNAVVASFLKGLDYFNGILFLTTNRLTSIDPAFYSRISLTFHYSNSEHLQRSLWSNLSDKAGIVFGNEDIDYFVNSYPRVNGRQIKNTIRIASLFASKNKIPVDRSVVDKFLKIQETFYKSVQLNK